MGGQGARAVGEGAVAHPAAGEHRRRRPRLHRAQARRAGPAAEALLHRPAVPPRAPAEGPLPPVLPDRRGGHRAAQRRLGVAAARCRGAGDAGHAARRARHHRLAPADQLRRHPGRPPALHRDTAIGACSPSSDRCARTASAARRPIRCACSTASIPRTSRSSRPCRASGTRSTRRRARTSSRYARRWMPAACPTSTTTGSSAAWTTTRAPPSSSSTAAWARRTRCSAAAATTASRRRSAAPVPPASASP